MSNSIQQKMFEGITNWQQSGLSQKAWCEQNELTYSVFHYWYRRFRNQQADTNQSGGKDFVQLLVQDKPSDTPWCELVMGNGKKLFFHQSVSAEFIRTLLD